MVHRSDGSGTTFGFADYLSKVNADLEGQGRRGDGAWNGRSASAPRATKASPATSARPQDSIGYVEYAYAKQNKLSLTLHDQQGRQGRPAELEASFQAAAANADWASATGFGVVLTDEPGAESWPVAGATFILMHKQPQDPAAAAEALKFFDWAYKKGDKMAEDLDYVADAERRRRELIGKAWADQIKDKDGKPLFAG